MGYRSDVAYVIGFKDRRAMSEFIAVVMAVGTDHQREALKECCIDWANESINYNAEDVKWYDDYEDVRSHHELMKMAIERDENNGWVFTRIGEDDNDIEKKYNGNYWGLYDCVDVVRRLEVNVDIRAVGDNITAEIPDEFKD